MPYPTEDFFDAVTRAGDNIQSLEDIEDDVIGRLNSTKGEIDNAKGNGQIQSLETLEKESIDLRGKLKYISEHIENIIENKDTLLRPKEKVHHEEQPMEELGSLFKDSPSVVLTQNGGHFTVEYKKQIYRHHILFKFDIKNELDEQVLEELTVEINGFPEGIKIVQYTPCPVVKFNDWGTMYTLARFDHSSAVTGSLSCTMKFKIKDFNPASSQYDHDDDGEAFPDEFLLGNVEVTISDHVRKAFKSNWSASWEEIGEENELEHTHTLSIPTLEEYVKKIISFIGMQPCEQSDIVAENKTSHTLYLAGIYRGGHDVLVRVRMVLEGTSADYPSTTTTITIQLTIRSTDKSAVQVIASAMAYVNKQ